MAKLKLDLHDIFNKGDRIEDELHRIVNEAVAKRIALVEIIPGKGSGVLKEKVLKFLNQSHIRKLYHRVEKDSKNFGRIFIHFRFENRGPVPLTDYSHQVADHLLHPRKLGTLTDKDLAPGEHLVIGDAGQVTRGDALRLSLKLDSADSILDARFQNFGTGLPIAGASCLCTLLIGKSVEEAWRVSALDLDRELHGLPELKLRKPVLALLALDNALRKIKRLPAREKNSPGEQLICTCYQVGAGAIERAIRLRHLSTLDKIIEATRAGAGCHTCHPEIEHILARCAAGNFTVHLNPDDYSSAQKLFGTPPPDARELSLNPPPPIPQSPAPVPRSPAPDRAPDGFVYPSSSPVAAAVARNQAQPPAPRKPWPELSHAERLALIEYHLEHNLRPAIHADGGEIKLLDLDDCRVRVVLSGHCRNCFSALSTLKLGVEKHLRDAVWPELEVEEVVEGY